MEPFWKGISLDKPFTKVALPLFAVYGDTMYPSGTACLIGPFLALTARHVVEDHFEKFLGRMPRPSDEAAHHTFTYVLPGEGAPMLPLLVQRTWFLTPYDLAVLWLSPAGEMDTKRVWDVPVLKLFPPTVGSRVFAVGYPKSIATYDLTTGHEVTMDATITGGTVIEVHPERVDTVLLPFPCFRTNARFDAGMSGGPVFNDNGQMCGVICSSLETDDAAGPHTSYASTLWPALAIPIDAPWTDRYREGTKYPLYEYATAGIISTVGLDRLASINQFDYPRRPR